MDRNSLEFVELFEYDSHYSEGYLDRLMDKAAAAWQDVTDTDAWLDDLRGASHA